MPPRPLRPCGKIGCSRLARERFCEEHKSEAEARRKARWRRYDNSRGTAAQRGYGAVWRRLRLMVLHEEPLCRMCSAPSQEVDHIQPLSRGGTNERENLQGLCRSCHSRKTAGEGPRPGSPGGRKNL